MKKKYKIRSKEIIKIIQKFNHTYDIKPLVFRGMENHYLVDTIGDVYSIYSGKPKKLKPQRIKRYASASLSINGKFYKALIHKLVMDTFSPNPDPEHYTEVNHIDGHPRHNWIENLEWTTHSENIQHAYDNNLFRDRSGENAVMVKITKKQAKKICKLLSENKYDVQTIAKMTNTTHGTVYSIKYKDSWTELSKHYKIENHNVVSERNFITKEVVHDICKDLQDTDMTYKEIADKYRIQDYRVSCIARGVTWPSISKDYDFSHRFTK